MGVSRALLIASVGLAACVDAQSTVCDDGSVCPPGLACFGGGCYSPAQIDACVGRAEGDPCTYGAVTEGALCRDGVCVVPRCGDQIIDDGEECDDGNNDSGDDCSSDCRVERCGNGRFDVNESCDCGDADVAEADRPAGCRGANSDTSGPCSSACALNCGDGIANSDELCDGAPPKLETCLDFGYDAGHLACTDFCTIDLADCLPFGWRPELGGGKNWTDVARIGATGFAVADDGTGARLVDGNWEPTTAAAVALLSVAAVSETEAWAVGNEGSVVHYTGQVDGWGPTEVIGPNFLSWEAVFAVAAADVWMAGADRVYHYNGQDWAEEFSAANASFHDLWVGSGIDIWVVGNGLIGGLAYHYDGDSWTPHDLSSYTPNAVAVQARSPTEVWVLGGGGEVLIWDGDEWKLDQPAGDAALSDLYLTADEAFIVGDFGLILHQDAFGWTRLDSGTQTRLYAVHGTSPLDVTAAGASTLRRWSGTGWAMPESTGTDLYDVKAASPTGPVYAVGDLSQVLQLDDQGSWINLAAPPNTWWLEEIWPDPDGVLWGAGMGNPAAVVRLVDDVWEDQPVAAGQGMRAAWGDGDYVYVGGEGGTVFRWELNTWLFREPIVSTSTILDLWGNSFDLWGVGDKIIVHFDGQDWSEEVTPEYVFTVWGDGAGVVRIAGTDGIIRRREGDAWVDEYAAPAPLGALAGSSPTDLFGAGATGTVVWNDGQGWAPVRSGEVADLLGLWVTPRAIFFVGTGGTILRLVRSQP